MCQAPLNDHLIPNHMYMVYPCLVILQVVTIISTQFPWVYKKRTSWCSSSSSRCGQMWCIFMSCAKHRWMTTSQSCKNKLFGRWPSVIAKRKHASQKKGTACMQQDKHILKADKQKHFHCRQTVSQRVLTYTHRMNWMCNHACSKFWRAGKDTKRLNTKTWELRSNQPSHQHGHQHHHHQGKWFMYID